jgi:preprotein translocase subunit SecD
LLLAGAAAADPLVIEVVVARAAYDTRSKEPLITFKMLGASKKAFTDPTRANVGHKSAIRIDGKTLSPLMIAQPILGGAGQIAGDFTVQQIRETAAKLNAGTSKFEVGIVD